MRPGMPVGRVGGGIRGVGKSHYQGRILVKERKTSSVVLNPTEEA